MNSLSQLNASEPIKIIRVPAKRVKRRVKDFGYGKVLLNLKFQKFKF